MILQHCGGSWESKLGWADDKVRFPAIVERVYQWWRTQNVLLIFYEVDFLPEAFLRGVIARFLDAAYSSNSTRSTPASAREGSNDRL